MSTSHSHTHDDHDHSHDDHDHHDHDHSHHDHDHHDHDHAGHHHHHHDDSLLAPNTKLTLVIPWADANKAYQQVLKRQAQHVKTAGFRKGKVPAKLAEEVIGQDKLIDAALNQLIPVAYTALIQKEKRLPLTQPDIRPLKLTMGEDWEFEVQIGERPTIKLGSYQQVAKDGRKTAQEEIKKTNQERAAAKKSADQKPKSDKTAAKTDEPATTPEAATEPLTKEKEEEITLRHIFRALVEKIKPAIPELLVREETRRELEQLVRSLEQFKFTLDDYLKRRGQTFEQLSGEIAATMLGQIQIEFILDAIAEDGKIAITEAEIDEVGERIEDKATRESQLKNEQYRRYVKHQLRRQKVTELLLKA